MPPKKAQRAKNSKSSNLIASTGAAPGETPARQNRFVSSVEVRKMLMSPFPQNSYYTFKKHPRWPKPVVGGNGGKDIYDREAIIKFFDVIAEEGFNAEPSVPPNGPLPHPPSGTRPR